MSKKATEKTCIVCGKISTTGMYLYGDGYICSKHKKQLNRHGKFLERTIYDPNEITINGNIAYIHLYNKQNEEIGRAIIDSEEVDRIKKYKWYLGKNGYVYHKSDKAMYLLHRFIMSDNIEDSEDFVDHINRNPLDCRKSNLRVTDNAHNNMNNGGIGISYNKEHGVWEAYITANKTLYKLGYYSIKEEALYARWYAETLLFKEYQFKKEEPNIAKDKIKILQKKVEDKINKKKENKNYGN